MSVKQSSQFGHRLGSTVNGTFTPAAASVASAAALKAIPAADRVHGDEVLIDGQNSRWKFHSTSALVDDGGACVLAPSAGTGVWLRMPGDVDLALPIGFATADAAVLLTFQAGMIFLLRYAYWKVTTSWTGGSSSAIGISSGTLSGATTKGDLLGGASGDVLATLVSTGLSNFVAGTVGAQLDTVAHLRTKVFQATDTIRFDRITSAFTAGAGEAHLVGDLIHVGL